VTTPLTGLQTRLQHQFKDLALLQRAVTHRSFSADHNERLEFLGDSVLGMVIAGMLYERLKDLPEGDLSRVRANLVRQETLYQLALELRIPEVLRLGEGESKSGGQKRPSILADALEALIGAVYLDAGFEVAKALVTRLFKAVDINPHYRVVGTLGAAHEQTFEVECEIDELNLNERGIGSSRRAGEQAAAAVMLQCIKTALKANVKTNNKNNNK
jgi:ribonuclease III